MIKEDNNNININSAKAIDTAEIETEVGAGIEAEAVVETEDAADDSIGSETEEMYPVVGVRFKDFGKVYYFDPCDIKNLEHGDGIIVETVHGVEFATVTSMITEIAESKLTLPLRPIIRKATPDDYETINTNKELEKRYLKICETEIAALKLEMELIDCERSFDGGRVTFYFTADGRVDFRELVRKLASQLKTRIELRQIGVRDKAKIVGGVGSCGRVICCAAHLSYFEPVSIKMAKDQGIALNPTKISGVCGRLMCCLKYEQDSYEKMRKRMPTVSSEVKTPDGDGIIVENNVLTEHCKVKVTLQDGTLDLREYPLADIVVTKYNRPSRKKEHEEDAALKEIED